MPKLKVFLVACVLAAAAALPAAAAELGTQKNTDRGVTVEATPQNPSDDGKSWNFKIVFDTHSQELSDDVLKSAILLDGTGGRYVPVTWEGAGPGGHHREGVLRFQPLSSSPKAIELQIARPGESAPRSFRWQLN